VSLPANATILAFDFGTRRIGVAVGNTILRTAQPLATLSITRDDAHALTAIRQLVEQWQPELLVVGLPVHADGTPHAMTRRARRFARDLENEFARPVRLVDERYTTAAAAASLRESRAGRAGRAVRDELAAQAILQAFLDEPDEQRDP